MIKDIKDAREISLYDVLDGNYVNINYEYKQLDEETCDELFKKFKAFVSATARGNRKWRIFHAWKSQVYKCGILRRLVYNLEREKVEYCCGQEWYSEMAILRDCFDRR